METPVPIDELLKRIRARIEIGNLLPPSYCSHLDWNATLERRDSDANFAKHWLDSELALKNTPLAAPLVRHVDAIRERAYGSIFSSTGNPDAAAHISADFGLIAGFIAAGQTTELVDRLWWAFNYGGVPFAERRPFVPGTLPLGQPRAAARSSKSCLRANPRSL